jgi:hypothetical protein
LAAVWVAYTQYSTTSRSVEAMLATEAPVKLTIWPIGALDVVLNSLPSGAAES